MRSIVNWIRRHARRMARYAGAQVIFQIINAVTGFILVRSLPKDDYAWFTISNSLLSTISILADSGLGSATTSIGGTLIGEPTRFAGLIRATRRLRFIFSFGAGAVVLPAGWWVLRHNQASVAVTIMLLSLTLVTALFAAEVVVLNTINRLHTRLRYMVQADLSLSSTRLILVFGAWCAGLTAILAVITTTLSQWLQTLLLRRQTKDIMHKSDDSGTNWNPAIMQVVKHSLPLCIFSCVQGHLTTWLLSVFASSHDVADVGALSRLSVIFNFMSIPMAQLISPAIARCQDHRRLKRLCLAVTGGYMGAGAGMAVLGSVFSNQLLWLLGPKYSHLHVELSWYLGYMVLGLLSTVIWGIVLTRSWVRHGWLGIPLTIGLQVIAALYLDLSKVKNALIFTSVGSIAGIVVGGALILKGLHENQHRSDACLAL